MLGACLTGVTCLPKLVFLNSPLTCPSELSITRCMRVSWEHLPLVARVISAEGKEETQMF